MQSESQDGESLQSSIPNVLPGQKAEGISSIVGDDNSGLVLVRECRDQFVDELATSTFANSVLEGAHSSGDVRLEDSASGFGSYPADGASHGNGSDSTVWFVQGHQSPTKVGFQGFGGAVANEEIGDHLSSKRLGVFVGCQASPVFKPRAV